VEIDFDPHVTSYAQLLDIFWQSHSATTALPRQYMSAIWYHNDTQKQLASQTKEQQQQKMKKCQLVTLIAPAQRFYLAEDYHQKYYLQGEKALFNVLKLDPRDAHAIANSRVATRLNAFVGGYTTLENLEMEFDSFELSDSAQYTSFILVFLAFVSEVCSSHQHFEL
jgi:peptide-methionine (S)-S-oxide reductase